MDITDNFSIGGLGVVTVFIGLNKTPFTAHCDFLCRASSYFKDQISAERKQIADGSEYSISKLDEDPRIADIFFLWIYTREYNLGGKVSQGLLPDACVTQAIRLYCFAVKFGVPDLSMKILEELFTMMQTKRIQLKYSQLESIWEEEYTDARLQTLVMLYISYNSDVLAYDDIDFYNWLRGHGSIAVDLLRMQKEKYTNPNACNPFGESFAHKTFRDNALKEKEHVQDGGQPDKPNQGSIQKDANRQTGKKDHDAQRKCSEQKVDQQTQGVGAGGAEIGSTDDGKTQVTATQGSTHRSNDVDKVGDQHANARKGSKQSGNKRKISASSSKNSSGNKKARKRSNDNGGNIKEVAQQSSHEGLRRNPSRRTVGGLRPYRGKV